MEEENKKWDEDKEWKEKLLKKYEKARENWKIYEE